MAKTNQKSEDDIQHTWIKKSLSFIGIKKDITIGHLRFPFENIFEKAGSPRNDHWNFNNAKENIVQDRLRGDKQTEGADDVISAITSLKGQEIESGDKTFIYCRPDENTGIEFDLRKPHRMTLNLNSNKLDEYAAALKVAAYRQERFRENPRPDNELYSHDALMPNGDWCKNHGVVITRSKTNENRFSISARTQEQTMPLQQDVGDGPWPVFPVEESYKSLGQTAYSKSTKAKTAATEVLQELKAYDSAAPKTIGELQVAKAAMDKGSEKPYTGRDRSTSTKKHAGYKRS